MSWYENLVCLPMLLSCHATMISWYENLVCLPMLLLCHATMTSWYENLARTYQAFLENFRDFVCFYIRLLLAKFDYSLELTPSKFTAQVTKDSN